MTFKSEKEAFNYYRTSSRDQIEHRAAEIKGILQNDPNADVATLTIELDGLGEAMDNLIDRAKAAAISNSGNNGGNSASNGDGGDNGADGHDNQRSRFNPITSMSFDRPAAQTPESIFGSREYRSAFHRMMTGQPMGSEDTAVINRARQTLAAERRDTFFNTTDSAAVIPTQTLEEIFKKAALMGGVLPVCRRFDIPANLAVSVATPEDMAAWHVEGSTVTPTNQIPASVTFHGYELMKLFSMSAATKSMSITAFEAYLQTELMRTMIVALDSAAISGTGTGQPLGLLANGVISSVLLAQPATYATFVKAAGTLMRGYSMGASWAMSNATFYNSVLGLEDSLGRPIFIPNANTNQVDTILGKPLVIDDFIPDGTVIFGNFQYYGVNYPLDILLEVSRESSFRQGLIDYRSLAVADARPIVADAFVKVTLE